MGPDERGLGQDMAAHRSLELRLRRPMEIRQGVVQRVELEEISVAPLWRARSAVTRSLSVVKALQSTAGKVACSFKQLLKIGGKIVENPMHPRQF